MEFLKKQRHRLCALLKTMTDYAQATVPLMVIKRADSGYTHYVTHRISYKECRKIAAVAKGLKHFLKVRKGVHFFLGHVV